MSIDEPNLGAETPTELASLDDEAPPSIPDLPNDTDPSAAEPGFGEAEAVSGARRLNPPPKPRSRRSDASALSPPPKPQRPRSTSEARTTESPGVDALVAAVAGRFEAAVAQPAPPRPSPAAPRPSAPAPLVKAPSVKAPPSAPAAPPVTSAGPAAGSQVDGKTALPVSAPPRASASPPVGTRSTPTSPPASDPPVVSPAASRASPIAPAPPRPREVGSDRAPPRPPAGASASSAAAVVSAPRSQSDPPTAVSYPSGRPPPIVTSDSDPPAPPSLRAMRIIAVGEYLPPVPAESVSGRGPDTGVVGEPARPASPSEPVPSATRDPEAPAVVVPRPASPAPAAAASTPAGLPVAPARGRALVAGGAPAREVAAEGAVPTSPPRPSGELPSIIVAPDVLAEESGSSVVAEPSPPAPPPAAPSPGPSPPVELAPGPPRAAVAPEPPVPPTPSIARPPAVPRPKRDRRDADTLADAPPPALEELDLDEVPSTERPSVELLPEPATEASVPKPPPPPRRPPPPAPRELRDEADNKKPLRRPWWEELFLEDFGRADYPLTDDQLFKEVNFIEESLGVAGSGVILDLCCGSGRHAVELARRGYGVVGFDLSLYQLALAQDVAEERRQKISFVQGDVRDMAFEETFDGIYSWNTSYGYFEEEKNFAVAQRMFRALRPGGSLLIDVPNRDFVARHSPSQVWFEGDGCVCMDDASVDFITSRLRVKRSLILDDGRQKECYYTIRLYSMHELGKLLHDVGFRVVEASGDLTTPNVFLGAYSPRIIMLAQRP